MKKVILIGVIALSLGILFMSVENKASAQVEPGQGYGYMEKRQGFGGMRRGLAVKAEFLGISEEELQAKMTEGKTMIEIAEELGKSFDDLKNFMLSEAKARWVEKGLTQEEIDERTQWMQEKHENCEGDHSQMGSPWMGRGMRDGSGFGRN